MNIATWVDAHGWALLIGWYLFSALVSGMPEPATSSTSGYRWLYHSLHALSGDLARLVPSREHSASDDSSQEQRL